MKYKTSSKMGCSELVTPDLKRGKKVGAAHSSTGTLLPFPPLKGGRGKRGRADRFLQALQSFPQPGSGVHQHILSCANYGVRLGLSDEELEQRILAAMPRDPSNREISDAIDKARTTTGTSSGNPRSLRERIEADREKKLTPLVAVSAVKRLVKEAGGPLELDLFRQQSPVELGPLNDPEAQRNNAGLLLQRLHHENAYLYCGDTYGGGLYSLDAPLGWERNFEQDGVPPLWIPNALSGRPELTGSGTESFRCDAAVVDARYLVYECDHAEVSLADQAAFLSSRIQAGWPVRSVVFSGGKSLHALLEVSCASRGEWDLNVKGELKQKLVSLGADPACFNLARLSRLPGHRRDNGNLQALVWLSAVK